MQNMGKPYDESRAIGIEFYNKTDHQKKLWVEPSCIELILESKTEYRVEADDMEYRIEFDEEYVILYLQYRFGPKIYKRPYSSNLSNSEEWLLDTDYSSIN